MEKSTTVLATAAPLASLTLALTFNGASLPSTLLTVPRASLRVSTMLAVPLLLPFEGFPLTLPGALPLLPPPQPDSNKSSKPKKYQRKAGRTGRRMMVFLYTFCSTCRPRCTAGRAAMVSNQRLTWG